MEHVTFDRMPHALGLLLDRLEALRAEVAELRAAVSPPPAGGGAGGGLMAFSEACAYLGVGRTTLSRWKKEGIVPYVRVGAKAYFRAADLESYNRHDVRRPRRAERGRA